MNINTTNAVSGVSAKMKSGKSVTSSMSVKIKAPGAGSYTTYSYAKAKAYKFTKAGTYYVQYVAKNVNKPNRAATKTVKITVLGDDDAVIKSPKTVTVEYSATEDQIKAAVYKAITITDNGTTVKSTSATVTVSKDTETGVITATVSYKGKNGKTVKVTVNVEQEAQQSAEEQTDQPVEQ